GGTGGSVNPFQTIQRQEVGVTLKVTPKINEGDAVIMKIEQEVSSISQGAQGAVDLITNKRTINTNVIAEDGEIIVLGGLIDDNLLESEQRVPVLGAIPVLGNLFRFRTSKKVKRNLMVFMRPQILRNNEDAAFYTNSKYSYIRDLQRSANDGKVQLMPKEVRPTLPPIEEQRRIMMPADPEADTENEESEDNAAAGGK
ncbi:MAG: type II secretion system protein GspD, partial [Gammaproteobacteria bacterium]|nr:type II secretion system protein GspD [Gammaproteobacteria bacterium]